MIIRKFKKKDLEAILQMTKEAWDKSSLDQAVEGKFGKREKNWWECKSQSVKEFIDKHPNWLLVAEENCKIVGYASYSLDNERKVGNVLNNAVHPYWRGRGIGKTLHHKVLEELKKEGMEIALLVTSQDNVPARRMYESAGFEQLWCSLHYGKKLKRQKS